MQLEDNEIRMTWYALQATKEIMESELQKKKDANITETDFVRAQRELDNLKALFDKVNTEKEKLMELNPFTYYPNVFYPGIVKLFDKK